MFSFFKDLKREFCGYNLSKLLKDLMAGITVAAVALPLALAFGVSSGADAAAGLITAIIAGVVIGALSGASYQISGPTGAMAAILISIVSTHGIAGVFLASAMAGVILLLSGIFKIGKLVNIIPMPVIAGFTSGIAIIIALGQVDNFFGTTSTGTSALEKIVSYFVNGFNVDYKTLILGMVVVLIMIFYPKKLTKYLPSSLASLIVVLILNAFLKFDVALVGEIPKTLLPQNRLSFDMISIDMVKILLVPAISIAALGMIESLLCASSASRMKNEEFNANRELISQGVGNILLPFFGGVPATAAIARTSVAIKAGSVTRLTSIFHSLILLLSMFVFSPIMSKIPLCALAGVLIITAWRMNDWGSIKYIFSKKFVSAIIKFLVTMLATVVFDLTIAILLGVGLSVAIFVYRSTNFRLDVSPIDTAKLNDRGISDAEIYHKAVVCYLTGPVFFGTIDKVREKLSDAHGHDTILLSMRGVPHIDTSGTEYLYEFVNEAKEKGTNVCLCGLHDSVLQKLTQGGIIDVIGKENVYWSVDVALGALPKNLSAQSESTAR